ncbi:unnamed protein product [Soboliphyme baturini]|uniref:Cysteine-rich motor neuron 1 protein n=1 Tax=Soboliphyme baturini TaxID=241478 RepID=A0A183IEY4_9BILA|nr:unnamed protein product [Soboliphyme baturini]
MSVHVIALCFLHCVDVDLRGGGIFLDHMLKPNGRLRCRSLQCCFASLQLHVECLGCLADNIKLYNVSESWRKDECTTCSCVEDGTVVCQVQVCSDDCENPVYVDNQCCPTCASNETDYIWAYLPTQCLSMELCSLVCEHGLKSDNNGCLICECENSTGSSNCTEFDLATCTKKCCKGCPQIHTCYKHCLYGFQTNVNGCRICKCRGSPSDLPNDEAGNSSSLDLAVCYSDSGFHDHGEWWFDNCRHCYCDRGREFCSLLACPKPNCTHPVFSEGECCPRCPGKDNNAIRLACHAPSDTHHYVEGEYWNLDSCVTCTCHVGYVLCYRKECPPVPCSEPKIIDDQCCPVCSDKGRRTLNLTFCTTENGVSHMEGSVWKETQCISCACENGKINCYEEECLDVPCYTHVLHLKDSCCPVCTDNMRKSVCRINDVTYNVGETWREGPCRNCTCMSNSEILCSQLDCRKCSKPVYAAGQCCPICDDYPKTWRWRPTPSYPEITGRYNDAQQVSLILALSIIGILGLLLLLVLLTFWFLKRFRAPPVSKTAEARLTSFKFEEKGKALLAQMKTSSNGVCNGLAIHKTNGGLLNDVDGSVNDWANDDV